MMVFVNTVLGRVWRHSIDLVEPEGLIARVEPFGLQGREFPREVSVVCAGVDTQPDRFEVVLWGWSETQAYALGHFIVWGSPNDVTTQNELDALLRTIWQHPNGWQIGIEAVAIDFRRSKYASNLQLLRASLSQTNLPNHRPRRTEENLGIFQAQRAPHPACNRRH